MQPIIVICSAEESFDALLPVGSFTLWVELVWEISVTIFDNKNQSELIELYALNLFWSYNSLYFIFLFLLDHEVTICIKHYFSSSLKEHTGLLLYCSLKEHFEVYWSFFHFNHGLNIIIFYMASLKWFWGFKHFTFRTEVGSFSTSHHIEYGRVFLFFSLSINVCLRPSLCIVAILWVVKLFKAISGKSNFHVLWNEPAHLSSNWAHRSFHMFINCFRRKNFHVETQPSFRNIAIIAYIRKASTFTIRIFRQVLNVITFRGFKEVAILGFINSETPIYLLKTLSAFWFLQLLKLWKIVDEFASWYRSGVAATWGTHHLNTVVRQISYHNLLCIIELKLLWWELTTDTAPIYSFKKFVLLKVV